MTEFDQLHVITQLAMSLLPAVIQARPNDAPEVTVMRAWAVAESMQALVKHHASIVLGEVDPRGLT